MFIKMIGDMLNWIMEDLVRKDFRALQRVLAENPPRKRSTYPFEGNPVILEAVTKFRGAVEWSPVFGVDPEPYKKEVLDMFRSYEERDRYVEALAIPRKVNGGAH